MGLSHRGKIACPQIFCMCVLTNVVVPNLSNIPLLLVRHLFFLSKNWFYFYLIFFSVFLSNKENKIWGISQIM